MKDESMFNGGPEWLVFEKNLVSAAHEVNMFKNPGNFWHELYSLNLNGGDLSSMTVMFNLACKTSKITKTNPTAVEPLRQAWIEALKMFPAEGKNYTREEFMGIFKREVQKQFKYVREKFLETMLEDKPEKPTVSLSKGEKKLEECYLELAKIDEKKCPDIKMALVQSFTKNHSEVSLESLPLENIRALVGMIKRNEMTPKVFAGMRAESGELSYIFRDVEANVFAKKPLTKEEKKLEKQLEKEAKKVEARARKRGKKHERIERIERKGGFTPI